MHDCTRNFDTMQTQLKWKLLGSKEVSTQGTLRNQSRARLHSNTALSCKLLLLIATSLQWREAYSQASNAFTTYFNKTSSQGQAYSKQQAEEEERLLELIPTMSEDEVSVGIAAIDQKLDEASDPNKPSNQKEAAAYWFRWIASRPDGWKLLSSQLSRLTAMMKGPNELFGLYALQTFQMLSMWQPNAVKEILEDALQDPAINKSAVGGAGVATFLLWTGRDHDETTAHVVEYMQRPELTDTQMVNVIRGITQTGYMTPGLINELIRNLDRKDDLVKASALALIEKGGAPAREAAQSRLQRMANDPKESAAIRQSATSILIRKATPISSAPQSQ